VDVLVALGTAFLLGAVHALEMDHMIAVTAFVAGRPALTTAAGFGFRWGAGHGLAVLLAGGLLLATGLRWPERWDAWGEAAVGVMLVIVGLWALGRARKLHLHAPAEHGDHAHLHVHGESRVEGRGSSETGHVHAHSHAHPHRHGITAVGLVHGLAGTSAVVALVPVTMMSRPEVGVLYLVAFGVGTVLAMAGFALAAAAAMHRMGDGSLAWARRLGSFAGVGAVGVGLYWIFRAVA
jgi:ABC-type nickel/cobalt efflux system permease component RcnA